MQRLGKVTRKGQITIPIEIRRKLGWERGDKVVFTLKGEEILIKKP